MLHKVNAKKKRQASDVILDVITYGVIIVAVLITLYPLYFVVIASISDPVAVSNGKVLFWPKGFNLLGYKKIFEDARIWLGFRNTIIYTVLGTLFSLTCTIPAAYALSRKELPFRGAIMFFFTFTMFFGGGLIPTYFLMKDLHLTNNFWVMIIPFAVSVYNVIVARTFFQSSIPEELLDAAKIDGCSYTRFFLQIALPLSKAIIAVIGLYYAVGYWNEYMRALIYIQDKKLVPLQVVLREILVQNQAFETTATTDQLMLKRLADIMKYALIVVSTLPMVILYPLLQKYFEKGVMIGSVKG